MTLQEPMSSFYDLQVQKDELSRKLEEVNSQTLARKQENQKLSLFYQHELQKWLNRLQDDKSKWQQKRSALSTHCSALQKTLDNRWSSTDKRLRGEKEKYCNVIVKLLPEWQRAIERNQMKEIAEYESKASLIKQRRHSAVIAFEKEKKLLSLLSIRKQEIDKLQEEEKQDALIRKEERKSISMQLGDFEDTLRSSRYHSFADSRFQEYVIRKEVETEMTRKFSAQIDDIKSHLIHNSNQRRRSSMTDTRRTDRTYKDDMDDGDDQMITTKSTLNTMNSTESPMDNDSGLSISKPKKRSISFAEDENESIRDRNDYDIQHHQHRDEEKEDTISSQRLQEEGKQTKRVTNQFEKEKSRRDHHSVPVPVRGQKKEIPSKETTTSEDGNADSLDSLEFEERKINNKSSLTLPVLSSDSDSDHDQENGNDDGNGINIDTDTSQIERAVGLIEISHGKQSEIQEVQNEEVEEIQEVKESVESERKMNEKSRDSPLRISITTENKEEIIYQSPKQKPPPKAELKLKRKFRARTSRNRLQFSVLASPTQNSEDLIGNITHNVGIHTETIVEDEKKNLAPKLSAKKINSLNDFDDDPINTPKKGQNDESSDDFLDFL